MSCLRDRLYSLHKISIPNTVDQFLGRNLIVKRFKSAYVYMCAYVYVCVYACRCMCVQVCAHTWCLSPVYFMEACHVKSSLECSQHPALYTLFISSEKFELFILADIASWQPPETSSRQ